MQKTSYPPLDREEERRLIRRGQRGDTDARNQVVMTCNAMIWKWCWKFVPGHHPRARDERDAMHQHVVGSLCERFPLFDLKRKVRFLTWATWWIRQQCQMFINKELHDGIRLPLNDGRRDSTVKPLLRGHLLSSPVSDTPDLDLRGILLVDSNVEALWEVEQRKARIRFIRGILARIGRRESVVLLRRAGGDSLRDIGEALGISKERVRQIEKRAEESFRYHLSAYEEIP